MKNSSLELTSHLFEKIGKIRLNDAAAIFGTTSNEANLQQLRKTVVELTDALRSNAAYDSAMAKYDEVVQAVDTAGLTGLISEQEITEYYALTDKIWAAIEKEK